MFLNDDPELRWYVVGVPIPLLASVSSDSRYSIAPTIPRATALTVEVPGNLGDILPLFLGLLYIGECEMTLVTVPPPLSMVVFSDCPLVCDLLPHFVWPPILDEALKESGRGSQQKNE
jgi:hypothetical protein